VFNPFQPVEKIKTEVWTSMPAKFRKKQRSSWSDPNRQGAEVECFLEGPSFDHDGNLWFVDIPFGRIFRVTPNGEWDLALQYDGWPNGFKFHTDGTAYICDYRKGLLRFDPKTARLETILETAYSESFKGLNDLHFARNGDLYFTDQGQTGIADPTGRVFRLRANGALERLVTNIPSPNGITLSTTEKHCYVAVTRAQQIWRLPLMADGSISKTGVAIQLSGGAAGPDGIENGFAEWSVGLSSWCGHLAFRFQHAAYPLDLFRRPAPPPSGQPVFWRARSEIVVHHGIALGRYLVGQTSCGR